MLPISRTEKTKTNLNMLYCLTVEYRYRRERCGSFEKCVITGQAQCLTNFPEGVTRKDNQYPPGRGAEFAEVAVKSLGELIQYYPDGRYRLSYAEGCTQLSTYLTAPGDRTRVRNLREEALAIAAALHEQDPKNGHYEGVYAAFSLAVGKIDIADGRFEAAEEKIVTAIRLNRRLVARYRDDPVRCMRLTDALDDYASIIRRRYQHPDHFISVLKESAEISLEARRRGPARLRLYERILYTYGRLAWAYDASGQRNHAEESLRKGIDLAREIERENPDQDLLSHTLAAQLFNDGLRLLARDPPAAESRFEAAERELKAKRGRWPASIELTAWQGFSLVAHPLARFRDVDAGIARLNEYLQVQPADPFALTWMAMALCEKGDYAKAIQHLEHYRTLGPSDADTLAAMVAAKTLLLKGEKERGREAFHIASRLLQGDVMPSFVERRYHDEVWRLVEGTEPPKWPRPLPKSLGVPLLFR